MFVLDDITEAIHVEGDGGPVVFGLILRAHLNPVHKRNGFGRQGIIQVEVVGIIFDTPEISDAAPDAIFPELVDIGDERAVLHPGFIRFIDNGVSPGGEVKFERFGHIPLEVDIAIPGESFIVESAEAVGQSGKSVACFSELAVHDRSEGEGVGDGIEVEGRNELEEFIVFDKIFERFEVFDRFGVCIIDTSGSAVFGIRFDEWVAPVSLRIAVVGAEVGDIPGFWWSGATRFFLANIGEVDASESGDIEGEIANGIPGGDIIFPGQFEFEGYIEVEGVIFRSSGDIGQLAIEWEIDAPFFRKEFVELNVRSEIVAIDGFAASFGNFLVEGAESDAAIVGRHGERSQVSHLDIGPGHGSTGGSVVEAYQSEFIYPGFEIEA